MQIISPVDGTTFVSVLSLLFAVQDGIPVDMRPLAATQRKRVQPRPRARERQSCLLVARARPPERRPTALTALCGAARGSVACTEDAGAASGRHDN